MFRGIAPTFVQGITHPHAIEPLIATHPSLLHFFQRLIILGEDVGHGANTSSLGNGERFDRRVLAIHPVHSGYADDGRAGVHRPLSLLRRVDVNDHLQPKGLGVLEELHDFLRADHPVRHRDGFGACVCGPSDLNLVHDQIGRDDGQGSRHLPLCFLLLRHHGDDVVVGASAGAFVSEDGHGGRAEFAKDRREGFGGGDFGEEAAPFQLAFVFGNDRDGALAFC
mmetsp:Transcript_17712/g.26820  ORF Transcript_17712/g.26820 Transcript_17712/m.26820 type:complete len:224 (+) Transcript_17712:585-1256(+)